MRLSALPLLCVLACVQSMAQGSVTADVDANAAMPPEVKAVQPAMQRGGATRFTVWGFDVYDATLWVARRFEANQWPQQPFALELRYLRDFEGEDIAKRSLDEMARSGPIGEAQSKQWLLAMKAAFPDVKKGDRLVGLYDPRGGARFFHNGVATGSVQDTDFARRFFGIWLGPQTSEPAMRDALLWPPQR